MPTGPNGRSVIAGITIAFLYDVYERRSGHDCRAEQSWGSVFVTTRFNPISGVEALDDLLEQSRTETVVLFNHDPHCPISARAFSQMEQVGNEVMLVDVSRERSLTREIQGRTGVHHESPQVIVLRDGQPAWSASHFAITTDAVQDATNAAD